MGMEKAGACRAYQVRAHDWKSFCQKGCCMTRFIKDTLYKKRAEQVIDKIEKAILKKFNEYPNLIFKSSKK